MDQANVLQIIITILGSGALFSFFQFLIQRKDTKEEKKNDNELKKVEARMEEKIKEREVNSIERHETTVNSLKTMAQKHNEVAKQFLDSFEKLKDNDKKIEEILEYMTENQLNMCNALSGLAHDKIVYMTDHITDRGCITVKEKATLDSIYKPYEAMGGNSHAKAGYEAAMDLDIVSEEEAKEIDNNNKVKKIKIKLYKNFKEDFKEEINIMKELVNEKMQEGSQKIIESIERYKESAEAKKEMYKNED